MKNKVIKCQDCCTNFIFTTKQQEYFKANGWADPIRCPNCRGHKKQTMVARAVWDSLLLRYDSESSKYHQHNYNR